MPPVRRRVFLYLTRGNAVLVLRHVDYPELLPEVPGGTIEPGERPAEAALREAREETGLAALGSPELLGRRIVEAEGGTRAKPIEAWYYRIAVGEDTPDVWRHRERHASGGGADILFELSWAPLAALPRLTYADRRRATGADPIQIVSRFLHERRSEALAPASISFTVAALLDNTRNRGSPHRRHRESAPRQRPLQLSPARREPTATIAVRAVVGEPQVHPMSRREESEVFNDPHRRQRRGKTGRTRSRLLPLVLVSLALWLPFLVIFPTWLVGSFVLTLFVGCVATALLPLLTASRAASSGARMLEGTTASTTAS